MILVPRAIADAIVRLCQREFVPLLAICAFVSLWDRAMLRTLFFTRFIDTAE